MPALNNVIAGRVLSAVVKPNCVPSSTATTDVTIPETGVPDDPGGKEATTAVARVVATPSVFPLAAGLPLDVAGAV